METKKMKTYTLEEMKDKYVGKVGTNERDEYEYELSMDILGKMIKSARQERHLTQEELGKMVGVQKAQISKLENSANSATIETILKVFKALKAEINFNPRTAICQPCTCRVTRNNNSFLLKSVCRIDCVRERIRPVLVVVSYCPAKSSRQTRPNPK